MTEPEKQQVLDRRARELARMEEPAPSTGPAMRVVEFVIGAERCAVESDFVAEVLPAGAIAPLPRASANLLGVANVRGRILPVIDLRAVLDAPRADDSGRYLLVLHNGGAELAILADEIRGQCSLAPEQLQGPLPALSGRRRELLRCVTPEGVAVVDPARILSIDFGNGGMA